MELTKGELQVLDQLAKGMNQIPLVASALQKSQRQTYTLVTGLREKGVLELQKGELCPVDKVHIALLLKLLTVKQRAWEFLADSAIPIYTKFLTPKSVQEVQRATKVTLATVYKFVREARQRNILRTIENGFVLNEKIWPELKEFLTEVQVYEQNIDTRVPLGATIYYKTEDEVVFSSKQTVDATPTAFSAYSDLGIQLFGTLNYYILPKKRLSLNEIVSHSIHIIQKKWSVRLLIYLALAYLKCKKEITIDHEILANLQKIFKGEKIVNYPTLQEIKDRAEVYDIEVKE